MIRSRNTLLNSASIAYTCYFAVKCHECVGGEKNNRASWRALKMTLLFHRIYCNSLQWTDMRCFSHGYLCSYDPVKDEVIYLYISDISNISKDTQIDFSRPCSLLINMLIWFMLEKSFLLNNSAHAHGAQITSTGCCWTFKCWDLKFRYLQLINPACTSRWNALTGQQGETNTCAVFPWITPCFLDTAQKTNCCCIMQFPPDLWRFFCAEQEVMQQCENACVLASADKPTQWLREVLPVHM